MKSSLSLEVSAPCNTPLEPSLGTNQNKGVQFHSNPTTTVAEKTKRHSFSMNNSVQSPRPHLVKNLEMPTTNVGIVDQIFRERISKKLEELTQNITAQQTLIRTINLTNSILKTSDLSPNCIYDKITEASQNGDTPHIQHHKDNEFGASYPKSDQIKNVHGNRSWPKETVPIDCKKLEGGEPLTNPPHISENILLDSQIHWPPDMNDDAKKKYLPQLSRDIGNFSGPITIRRLLSGEILTRDIGKGQSVKGSYWTKGNGKDFVHNGQCLHQNLAVKPEWNGGNTLAIFFVPNKGKFYVAEGKIASQKIETADGNYELKGGGTQLSILTPEGESFSGNEEIFNKCVAVITNTGIDLTEDIPDEAKKEEVKPQNPFI